MSLKILRGATLAQDTATGNIYIIDANGGKTLLTDRVYPTSLTIATPPTKTEYTVGESFDKAGMVVNATYSDGNTVEVASYTCTPAGELTLDDDTITVSFVDNGRCVTATQAVTVTE